MDTKKYINEHGKFNQFDKYSNIFKKEKENKPILKVPNLPGQDTMSGEKKSSTLDLETAKTLSGNPSLTREELKSFKQTTKDKQEIKSNI
jgi:hypothetical protein